MHSTWKNAMRCDERRWRRSQLCVRVHISMRKCTACCAECSTAIRLRPEHNYYVECAEKWVIARYGTAYVCAHWILIDLVQALWVKLATEWKCERIQKPTEKKVKRVTETERTKVKKKLYEIKITNRPGQQELWKKLEIIYMLII